MAIRNGCTINKQKFLYRWKYVFENEEMKKIKQTKKKAIQPKQQRIDSVEHHRIWQSKLNEKEFFDKILGPEK
jgi:hypothetical protein